MSYIDGCDNMLPVISNTNYFQKVNKFFVVEALEAGWCLCYIIVDEEGKHFLNRR